VASIHIGDTGTRLRVLITDETGVPVPLQSASEKVVILTSQSGVVKTRDAIFDTNGSDGMLAYITLAADIDEAGTWEITGRVTIGGNRWTGDPATFTVMY
jgi:hypothetical protein